MMKRGDIYWVDLDPTRGSEIKKLRPCVVVSATPINEHRNTVVVIPLSTSAKPRLPIAVGLNSLTQPATAVCDQIRCVDKTRLKKLAGHLSHEDLNSVSSALEIVLDL